MSLELAAPDRYILVVAYVKVAATVLVPTIIVCVAISVQVREAYTKSWCPISAAILAGVVIGCLVSLLWLVVVMVACWILGDIVYSWLRGLYDSRPG